MVTPRAREAGHQAARRGAGRGSGHCGAPACRLDLARLARDGALRVFVAHSYPLSQVADAHRYSMAADATGKIVLIP